MLFFYYIFAGLKSWLITDEDRALYAEALLYEAPDSEVRTRHGAARFLDTLRALGCPGLR